MKGQAIVEFALTFPLLMFLVLAMIGVAYFDFRRDQVQNGVEVLARIAIDNPDWRNNVAEVNSHAHCNQGDTPPDEFRDAKTIRLVWVCEDRLYAWFADIIGWAPTLSAEWTAVLAPSPEPTSFEAAE